MTVSKTRNMLVEVARLLFAKNGYLETTMNDIAEASGKGRRTLYTYFRNKEEIYLACIEAEIQIITSNLQQVLKLDLNPVEKIKTFISVHFNVFRDAVIRNGHLHSQFFSDILEVEKVRRKLDRKEAAMLAQILNEGKIEGTFCIDDVKHTAKILQLSMKGLEVPYIRETVFFQKKRLQNIYDFLFYGLKGNCSPDRKSTGTLDN